MNFEIKQSSKKDPSLTNYWNWSVWIEGNSEDLDRIKEVEYILHPTFPNRIRTMTSRRKKFKLSSKGWGEFNIHIRIYFKDDETPLFLNHYLTLFEEGTEAAESVFISAPIQNKDEARELADELEDVDVTVRSQDDLDTEGSLIGSLTESINDSDAFVIFNPGKMNTNQQFELNVAKSANKQIFIIDEDGNYTGEVSDENEQVFRSKSEMLDAMKNTIKGGSGFGPMKK